MRFGPLTYIGAGIAVAGLLALLVVEISPTAAAQDGAVPRLMLYFFLLMLFVSSFAASERVKLSEHARNFAIWSVIILSFVTLYTLRHEFSTLGTRVTSALMPASPQTQSDGSVTLTRSANGHFMASLDVMGPGTTAIPIYFLVDTGASRVSLTRSDAERLGYNTSQLSFSMPVQTANGMAMSARITLNGIVLGGRTFSGIPASVMDKGSDVSLLGMSFLDNLSSYTVERDRLILTP